MVDQTAESIDEKLLVEKEESSNDDKLPPKSEEDDALKKKKKKKKIHKLSLEETEDFNAKLRKRGVVYIARAPPRMGPTKAKQLLGQFGTITRIYLEEEDKATRKRRQRASGTSSGKRYIEGWVEYESKKVAKRVAQALNNTPITNHKRSVHYDDLWALKYLSKFQWSHLTEKVAYERRMREQKLKIEMMKARKENQAYSELVEAGKIMDRIEAKRRKREEKDNNENGGVKKQKISKDEKKRLRKFKQNAPVGKDDDRAAKAPVLKSLV